MPLIVEISIDSYNKAKKELSEEEFSKSYKRDSYEDCQKIIMENIEPDEMQDYLKYELLKSQRKMEKSINIIKALVVVTFSFSL